MTKREKIKVLKAMRKLIDTRCGPGYVGLCGANIRVTKWFWDSSTIERLSDLGIREPKYQPNTELCYWYPLGAKGDLLRKRAIDRAIARLKK